jgi:hypothetical protein
MTTFTQHVEDYLRLRRALGFKLDEHARLLRNFRLSLPTFEISVDVATHSPAGAVPKWGPQFSGFR